MATCTITNTEITDWYKNDDNREKERKEREDARDAQTKSMTALLVIQMAIYAAAWLSELDELEDAVEDLICLKTMLHRADVDVDYPWMKYKQDILYLPVPTPEMCDDAKLYEAQESCEGKGVDELGERYASDTCSGIPKGWVINEGEANQALSQSYTGSILSNSAKRRQEKFQKNKTRLVLSSQQATKMNIRPAIQDLNLSLSVHSKLSDIYAQGFNSAGLGLGSILGQGTL